MKELKARKAKKAARAIAHKDRIRSGQEGTGLMREMVRLEDKDREERAEVEQQQPGGGGGMVAIEER